MATLRSARRQPYDPDPYSVDAPSPEVEAGPVDKLPGEGLPTFPGIPTADPGGNPSKPGELNPGRTPAFKVGGGIRQSRQAPQVNAGPVDSQAFAGGGETTLRPPQVGLRPPSPGRLVTPRAGGLFSRRGGQYAGGLGLGAAETQQGVEDPSALIESLLALLGPQ